MVNGEAAFNVNWFKVLIPKRRADSRPVDVSGVKQMLEDRKQLPKAG